MKKILKFFKENLLISAFVIILVLIILVVFITLVKRGTFGLDNVNSVTLDCESPVNSPSEVECDIKMSYDTSTYNDNNKILSVNANYDLPNGVEYVSYLSNCTDCDIDEQTENGFAIVRLEGLANDFVIGKVKLSIPSDIEFGTEYAIGLKNIEFSDDEENMIEVANSSDTVLIDDGTISYVFTSSNYQYDETNNYIYTKTDAGNSIISKLDNLPEGFSYRVNGNKLEVKNTRDDVIKTIDIANFAIVDLTISDANIIVDSSMTVGDVIAKITANNVTTVVTTDGGANKTDTDVLANGDKLKIYHGSELVDTYTFSVGYLNIDSSVSIDETASIIYNLADNTDYSDLLSKIDTSGEIKLYDKNNNVKSSSDLMKTTDKLVITLGSETITYTISVLGDMNSDGRISINDVSKLYQLNKTFETSPPELIYIFTGDMNHDGTYSINDVSKLYQISKQR